MRDEYRTIHALQAQPEQQRNLPLNFFQEKLGLTENMVAGKSVLVAGCGLGNELRSVMALHPGFAAAVDLSSFIHDIRAPGASLARADIMRLPFKDEAFDLVINAGVMHHVSDPRAGFRELHRVTKRGGTISIGSIYPPHETNIRITQARERYGFHLMEPDKAARRLRLLLWLQIAAERVGLGGFAVPLGERRFGYRVRLGNVLDLYLPRYRHVIHPADVRQWFRDVGIDPKLPSNFRRFFTDASDDDFGCPAQNVGVKPATVV